MAFSANANLIEVIGMDPSMTNWGLARAVIDRDTGEMEIRQLEVITPDRITTKQVLQSSKDLGNAFDLYNGIMRFKGASKATFAELPVGSQNSRAMAGYGMCLGILGSYMLTTPALFQVTPTENKVAFTGKKNATKQEMIDEMLARHPETAAMIKYHQGKPVSWTEHMADAVGAIHAGWASRNFRAAFQPATLQLTHRLP